VFGGVNKNEDNTNNNPQHRAIFIEHDKKD